MNENITITTGDENLKAAIANLKNDIAILAEKQGKAKPQRKTVHFTGERTMSPGEATDFVNDNRYELRMMYAAYGLLRGKRFEYTERNDKEFLEKGRHSLEGCMYGINRVLNNYGYEIPRAGAFYSKDYEKVVRAGQ
jgi:hypothetical protein